MRIWDAVTGTPLGDPLGHDGWVTAVALGRAGDRDVIVSGSYDGTVRIWDVTATPVHLVYDMAAPVSAVALQPPLLAVAAGSSVCLLSHPMGGSALGMP